MANDSSINWPGVFVLVAALVTSALSWLAVYELVRELVGA